MSALLTELTLADGDGFYERLIQAMEGLEGERLTLFKDSLILLLANQVGDDARVAAALMAAREAALGE